jgi:hypothetical protein
MNIKTDCKGKYENGNYVFVCACKAINDILYVTDKWAVCLGN